MFDPLLAAVVIGAGALAIALLCGLFLILQNLGSTTLTLAFSAVIGAGVVFVIQAIAELKSERAIYYVNAEFTLDRATPSIRPWIYDTFAHAWRMNIEQKASTLLAAREKPVSTDSSQSRVKKLMTDFAVFLTLGCFGAEQRDWQLLKIERRGKISGVTTEMALASRPNEYVEIAAAELQRDLYQADNTFASTSPLMFGSFRLPPESRIKVKAEAIEIENPMVRVTISFDPPTGFSFGKPKTQRSTPEDMAILSDGSSQFVTSVVGINISADYSRLRSKSNDMQRYRDWVKQLADVIKNWFDDK